MSAITTTYNRPAQVKIANREAWLMAATERLIGRVIEEGGDRPARLRVSCGWPSRSAMMTASSKRRTLGQAWSSAASEDKAREVFISPALADEVRVMDVLLHELIHACLPADAGHGPAFQAIMRRVGLEGKPTATVAGDELVDELRVIAHEIGRYPHEKLDLEPGAKKPGRMVKGYCPDCGTILYGSRAAWDNATPDCGICETPYTVEPSPEQAAAWGLAPMVDAEPLDNVSTTVELKTRDGRFTLRTTKTGKREGLWTVTDHEAIEVGRRESETSMVDGSEVELELIEYAPRWTYRRDRADALAFIAAIRSGDLAWDAVELESDDEDEVDEDELGELGDWSADEADLFLAEDEDENPDNADGRLDEDEEEAYDRMTAYREESGRRTSEKIARGEEGALD